MSDDTKDKSKPLANPPFWRDVSNKLDKAMGWEGDYKDESRVRAIIHAGWHKGAEVWNDNPKEGDRAREQFNNATRPPSPPTQKDKEK